MKLEKNLYSLKDGGLTWCKHLKKGLFKCGFKQIEAEPCLCVKSELILMTYTDDCVALCPTQNPINNFVKSMKGDYHLTDDGDLSSFLDIQIERKRMPTGGQESHLTQQALIERICATVSLSDQCTHDTPTDKVLYKGGEPHKTDFFTTGPLSGNSII